MRTAAWPSRAEGQAQAEEIVSRHRLIERFLTDVVGVPWDDVHEEAENLEHAMSPRFEAYVKSAVGDAATCPHGHPIAVGQRMEGAPLGDCEPDARVRILRFENEAEDLLHYLKDNGIEPTREGTISARDDDEISVAWDDGEASTVTRSVAETVTVSADPSPPPRTALPGDLVLGGGVGRYRGARRSASGRRRRGARRPPRPGRRARRSRPGAARPRRPRAGSRRP